MSAPRSKVMTHNPALSPPAHAAALTPVWCRHEPNPDWLQYGGKWGSTVVAPALQEWFAGAENPVSRTWLQTVFFPLVRRPPTWLLPCSPSRCQLNPDGITAQSSNE